MNQRAGNFEKMFLLVGTAHVHSYSGLFFLKLGASEVCMQIDKQVEGTEAVCLDEPRSAESRNNKDAGRNYFADDP